MAYHALETPTEHVRNALQLARTVALDIKAGELDEARTTLRAIENRLAAALEKLEPARVGS